MVAVYVFKGGLTSAIYTEVLQFFMIVLGFAPVVYLGMKDMGGWDVVKTQLTRFRRIRASCNCQRRRQDTSLLPMPGPAPGSR